MHNHPNRIFGLDLLRAIAIVLVVVSHCTYLLPEFNTQLATGIRLLGATGVDLFFVLSGYLIGGILIKKIHSGKTKWKDLIHFWKRRWLRTLPNYFVVLILNVLIILWYKETLVESVWLFGPFLQNFTTPHPNFFTEAWSLSIEEYAYILLPIILFLNLNIFKTKNPLGVFLGTTVLVIAVLYVFKLNFYYNSNISNYSEWSSSFRKVVVFRLDAIYYGFLMIYFNTKYKFFEANSTLLLISGGLLFAGIHIFIVFNNALPETHTFFYTGIYLTSVSLSIAFVFPFVIKLKVIALFKGIITYVSTRSYAIYLVNYSLVLLTIQRYFTPSISSVFIYLIISLSLSELLYRVIEIPFFKLRARTVPR